MAIIPLCYAYLLVAKTIQRKIWFYPPGGIFFVKKRQKNLKTIKIYQIKLKNELNTQKKSPA